MVGVDLLATEPVAGAMILQADFTDECCPARLIAALGGPPDLILSDMAPNTIGHRQTDHLRIVGLIEAAADFAFGSLRPGGAFLAKAFQGGETAAVVASLKRRSPRSGTSSRRRAAQRAPSSISWPWVTGGGVDPFGRLSNSTLRP